MYNPIKELAKRHFEKKLANNSDAYVRILDESRLDLPAVDLSKSSDAKDALLDFIDLNREALIAILEQVKEGVKLEEAAREYANNPIRVQANFDYTRKLRSESEKAIFARIHETRKLAIDALTNAAESLNIFWLTCQIRSVLNDCNSISPDIFHKVKATIKQLKRQ
jgi:hypothetical protein